MGAEPVRRQSESGSDRVFQAFKQCGSGKKSRCYDDRGGIYRMAEGDRCAGGGWSWIQSEVEYGLDA